MAKYTIEDVEILRQKSGISYDEAVNLLEYHNGSLARSLVDLEKNGRIKSSASAAQPKGLKGIIHFLYCLRLKVTKGETTLVNLSALFMLVALGLSSHICVLGLIFSLILGYKISFERNSPDFADEKIDNILKNAKSNVQQSVSNFAKQFAPEAEKPQPAAAPRTDSAPSGSKPVNVPFADGGSVDVRDDGDGYHEADIR